MILPLGYPPIPKAWSNKRLPEGIGSTSTAARSPSFIIEPLPYSRSISVKTSSNNLSFDSAFAIITPSL